jgi:hypothetical protein
MDATKSYKFIGFGAMDVTKPYEFIRFGAMDVTKAYKFIGFGAMPTRSGAESLFGRPRPSCQPHVVARLPMAAGELEPTLLNPHENLIKTLLKSY